MLRFLRSSGTMTVVFILLVGIATWLPTLLSDAPHTTMTGGMPLFELFNGWLASTPRLSEWVALLLNLLAAILLMQAGQMYLSDKITYMPAFCYVLLTGAIPALQHFNPALVAVIFIIFAFRHLMKSFRNDYLSYAYFAASLHIALASLFFRPACFLLVAVWFCLLSFRPIYWREWAFSLLGFLLPYFWLYSFYFLFSDSQEWLQELNNTLFGQISTVNFDDTMMNVYFAGALIVCILTVIRLLGQLSTRKIIARNGFYLLQVIAIIILVLSFFVPTIYPQGWYVLAFSFSFFLSDFFMNVKMVRFGSIVLWMFILAIVVCQFLTYSV